MAAAKYKLTEKSSMVTRIIYGNIEVDVGRHQSTVFGVIAAMWLAITEVLTRYEYVA